MENKKISVIIPVYNVEKYLPKCLDSVLNQTYKNLEIILVDDDSSDGSGRICDEYAEADSRIKVIHKKNEGVAKARNDGLDIASGDYIGFADSDDWLEKDMYEMLLKNAVSYGADISMCGEKIYENGELVSDDSDGQITEMDNTEAVKFTVIGGRMGLIWNKIYKKKLLDNIRFSSEYGCSEDLMFVYGAVKNIVTLVFENKAKYNYFRRDGGITKGEFGYGAFGVVDVMRNMLNAESESEVYPYCIKGFTDAAYTVLSGIITSGKCRDRFDGLIKEVKSFRKEILFGGHHIRKDKIKVILMTISPKLYSFVIKKARNV